MPADHRRWLAIATAVLLLIAGCSGGTARDPLTASFTDLAESIPATVGIAFAPVGGNTVSPLGAWSNGVAWSTIKVPLAIAALRANRDAAQPLAVKAITESDNGAAEQLWSQLGPPDQAAHHVQDVLRDGGDPATVVESRRLRPPFTAFGQTQWTLALQAQFAAHLPCLADSGPVVELMQHLIPEQRWGLAADGDAAKGGWGPGQTDGYLVRQFGIVPTATGQVGVALAADAATFEAGADALNRMAHWVSAHKAELPAGRCAG
ncbi:hypothetical protein [Mycobacterium talmoniae]|uniref:hypothetical protein n=1 Tax=Mycobacterium talmoniae TaxID=1858794 RepID=UPI001F6029A1|nr:hypothetical protein [Mycobacterium talmoniae]